MRIGSFFPRLAPFIVLVLIPIMALFVAVAESQTPRHNVGFDDKHFNADDSQIPTIIFEIGDSLVRQPNTALFELTPERIPDSTTGRFAYEVRLEGLDLTHEGKTINAGNVCSGPGSVDEGCLELVGSSPSDSGTILTAQAVLSAGWEVGEATKSANVISYRNTQSSDDFGYKLTLHITDNVFQVNSVRSEVHIVVKNVPNPQRPFKVGFPNRYYDSADESQVPVVETEQRGRSLQIDIQRERNDGAFQYKVTLEGMAFPGEQVPNGTGRDIVKGAVCQSAAAGGGCLSLGEGHTYDSGTMTASVTNEWTTDATARTHRIRLSDNFVTGNDRGYKLTIEVLTQRNKYQVPANRAEVHIWIRDNPAAPNVKTIQGSGDLTHDSDGHQLKLKNGKLTGSYQVKLDAAPAKAIKIQPTAHRFYFTGRIRTGELTKKVSVSGPLTFTPTNYSVPQEVTVTGHRNHSGIASTNTRGAIRILYNVIEGDEAGYPTGYFDALDTPLRGSNDPLEGSDINDRVIVEATLPAVDISGPGSISESAGSAAFTITSNPAPQTDMTVNLEVSEGDSDDYLATGAEGSHSVTIRAGQTSVTHTVTLVDDTVQEPDGALTVKVVVGGDTSYSNARGPNTEAAVVLTDDDEPAVDVTAGSNAITEGETARFTLTISQAPLSNLTVHFNVTDSGNFASSGLGAQTVTILANSTTASYSVPTVNDSADEPDGTITLTVTDTSRSNGYQPGVAGVVAVSDDDVPAVTVQGGAAVTEGGTAVFTLTASPAPHTALTVNINVTDAGGGSDFLRSQDEGDTTVTIGTGGAATYSVSTVGDSNSEPNGAVTLTVKTGSNYAPGSPKSAGVRVNDDDEPLVSITGPSQVNEGGIAIFTLSVTRPLAQMITVNLLVADAAGSDFLDAQHEGAHQVTMASGSSSITYQAPTTMDNLNEPDGAITVTVQSGSGYKPGSPASASVNVSDDDVTKVGIVGDSAPITEGETAVFYIVAYPAPHENLNVTLTVADAAGGDFVASGDERSFTVTIPHTRSDVQISTTCDTSMVRYRPPLVGARSSIAYFCVDTVDDSTIERNGAVTATLDPSADPDEYALFQGAISSNGLIPQAMGSVSVEDNDGSLGRMGLEEGFTRQNEIASSTLPKLEALIQERIDGTAARGDLHSERIWRRALAAVRGEDPPLGLPPLTADQAQRLTDNHARRGNTELAQIWQLIADALNGKISGIAPQPPTDPAVKVVRNMTSVAEGGAAKFTLTRSPVSASRLAVAISVEQNGDFAAAGAVGETTVTIPAGKASAIYAVRTVDDAVDERNGSVVVAIRPGEGYVPAKRPLNAASIPIIDDDEMNVVAIASNAASVAEGDVAEFTIKRSSITLTSPLAVTVAVSQRGDFAAPGAVGKTTVTIPAGMVFAVHRAPTIDDAVDEPDGAVSATLEAGAGYIITGSPRASTAVLDDDLPQGLSVSIFDSQGAEGSFIPFYVRLSEPAPDEVSVRWYTESISTKFDYDLYFGQGTLYFRPGERAKTIWVETIPDWRDEPNERFTVNLEHPEGVAIADGVAMGTIIERRENWTPPPPTPVATPVPTPAATPTPPPPTPTPTATPAPTPTPTPEPQQQQQQQSYVAPVDLVSDVRGYAAETHHGTAHVERWKRVLIGLGVESYAGLTAMTAAEAQTYADYGWARWMPVATELGKAAAAATQQPVQ